MEVTVVGSGVVGLTTAFELAHAGYRVRVITRNYEEGASWVAGGMLAPFSEALQGELLEFSLAALDLFPDFIARLEEVSGCRIFYTAGDAVLRLISSEEEEEFFRAYTARLRCGEGTPEFLEVEKLRQLQGDLGRCIRGAWVFPGEGNVDAEGLMDSLLLSMSRLGVEVTVDEIRDVQRQAGEISALIGHKGSYLSDFYVFATGAWSGKLLKVPVFPRKDTSCWEPQPKGSDLIPDPPCPESSPL